MLRLQALSILLFSSSSFFSHALASGPSHVAHGEGGVERSMFDLTNTLKTVVGDELGASDSTIAFSANSFHKSNFVIYWGQGDRGEKPLSFYCDQPGVSIVVLGFIADYTGGSKKSPLLNLSDHCNDVEHCPDVAEDIRDCQAKGIKTIMSIGGAAGPYHTQKWDPDLLAWWMWNKFLGGHDRTLKRPFGDVILDGVDLDPEATSGEGYERFVDTLRSLYQTHYPPKEFFVTAAPQCPDLDAYQNNAMYNVLHPREKYDATPDMVFVQFYNNYCSASQFGKRFNFDTWDQWATSHTRRPVKIYLGILGKENHQDSGYVDYERLTLILDEIHKKKSFGGVMVWDANYAYSNRVPYLNVQYGQAIVQYLDHFGKRNHALVTAYEDLSRMEGEGGGRIPILIPVSKKYVGSLACPGQLFMLLHSVTCRTLAETFGVSTNEIDADLDRMGLNATALLNPGSSICIGLRPYDQHVGLNYVYNATSAP